MPPNKSKTCQRESKLSFGAKKTWANFCGKQLRERFVTPQTVCRKLPIRSWKLTTRSNGDSVGKSAFLKRGTRSVSKNRSKECARKTVKFRQTSKKCSRRERKLFIKKK